MSLQLTTPSYVRTSPKRIGTVNRIDIPHQSDWHTGDKCRDIALRCFNPPPMNRSSNGTHRRHKDGTQTKHAKGMSLQLTTPSYVRTSPKQSDRHTGDKCRDIALRCFNPYSNDPDGRLAPRQTPHDLHPNASLHKITIFS